MVPTITPRRIALALMTLVMACGDDATAPPQPGEIPGERGQIVDQSGAVFGWECDAERCRVDNIDQPIPECSPPSRPVYSYSWGYFMEITAACADDDGWGALPEWGRFVVCEVDEDCPVIRSQGEETLHICDAGYCKAADQAAYFDELPNKWMMMYLCIGDAPRTLHGDDPWATLMPAIDAACPGDSINSPCQTIPEGCPDPRG